MLRNLFPKGRVTPINVRGAEALRRGSPTNFPSAETLLHNQVESLESINWNDYSQ
jgi:hypothetical protein